MGKLTALGAKSLVKPGRHTDGDGLHLHVRSTGKKAWVLRFMRNGKLRDMGLGAFPEVSLADARVAAEAARKLIKAKQDPIADRRRQEAEQVDPDRTFRAAAEQLIARQKAGWKNDKHKAQWTNTLAAYAYPVFGDRHVKEVDTAAVLRALQPIWTVKPETASRVRGRIEAVLDAAKAMHWREGENPARWKGHLSAILPRRSKLQEVEHHPSLPYARTGAFLAALRCRPGASARAIEFAVLTAARSGEVRGLVRRELDLDAGMWTVPKERMKAGRLHRVPLSTAAKTLLAGMHVDELKPDDLVFPGAGLKKPLSDMSLTMVLRRMNTAAVGQPLHWTDMQSGQPITVHGFRSTFRVWAGEATTYPREVIEAALAHRSEDAAERAYQRSDLLEKRTLLMEAWGTHCYPSETELTTGPKNR